MVLSKYILAEQAYISHVTKLKVWSMEIFDSNLSKSAEDTNYAYHESFNICYGTNSTRLQSLDLTRGKIVSLVNSHKLTLTSLIKLIKHVAFIM